MRHFLYPLLDIFSQKATKCRHLCLIMDTFKNGGESDNIMLGV